jgi:hypothetical protein
VTAAYLAATLVAVVIDGAIVPSVPTATLAMGRVMAPPELIARFATRVQILADGALVVERNGRICTARGQLGDDLVRVPLEPLVRCLGGSSVWDERAHTLSITFARSTVVATPAPFDPSAPQVVPTAVFTPEPASPTPRAIATGSPRPRRTAIPVTPSWPMPSTPPRQ